MKLTIEKIKDQKEIEVVIKCNQENELVNEIKHALTYYQVGLVCKKDDQFFQLNPQDIYYIDALGHQVFVYTKKEVYNIDQKLYQLESLLAQTPFLRVNKSTIVNTKKIVKFKSFINGRMEARLDNDDRIMISRLYVPKLKEKLGGQNT
ncbi:MAG: LytTR family transcriptional regulator DNA-binding domain-containing protein [Acholeplasmataceae bacterium]|nr:LytTR family transcriptional regulator DNA-binding domain-containing protein [Acholeplasmataceae bacterium]